MVEDFGTDEQIKKAIADELSGVGAEIENMQQTSEQDSTLSDNTSTNNDKEKKSFSQVLGEVVNTVADMIPPAVRFSAARFLVEGITQSVKAGVRNDALAGQIKSPKDFLLSAGTAALTYTVAEMVASSDTARPVVDRINGFFAGVDKDTLNLAKNTILGVGAGLAADFATGQIQQPVDIARSIMTSGMATIFTEFVVDNSLKILADHVSKRSKTGAHYESEKRDEMLKDINNRQTLIEEEALHEELTNALRPAIAQECARFGDNEEKAKLNNAGLDAEEEAKREKDAKGWVRKIPANAKDLANKIPNSLVSLKDSIVGAFSMEQSAQMQATVDEIIKRG